MVFRKPFAFIIKHFKAFHLVMLITSIFIMFNANQIRSIIMSLLKSNAYMYPNADAYTRSPVAAVAIIGLIAAGMIYWLFKVRKKDLKYYTAVVLYYIGTLVSFSYLFNNLKILAEKDVTLDTLNGMRDVSLILTIVSVPIIIMSFIRALGFNIKQFNFSKDIKELAITDKDSEEFEVLIGQNNYKYARKARKTFREIKYLILENLFYITVVASAIIGVGLLTVGSAIYKNNHTISETEVTTVNNIYYVVNGTYITEKDMNGNILKPGYKYVIVNVAMQNLSNEKKYINYELYTLQTGRLVYTPIHYFQKKFLEIGEYLEKGTEIPKNKFINGNFIFEIPATMSVTRFNFRVLEGFTSSDKDLIVNHVNFAAHGKELDTEVKTVDLNLNQRINTNVIEGSQFNLLVKNATIKDYYNEKYITCKDTVSCSATSSLIIPEVVSDKTMIILDYDGVLNSEASYYNQLDSMEKFVDAYVHVEYMIGNKTYSDKANVLYKDVNGKIFLEVSRQIKNANSINLVFSFRNEKYNIEIK